MQNLNHLIKKYNIAGPRYTSFPPVPFWHDTPSEEAWIQHIKSKYKENVGIDLYVHVPYCESLCYYCGCSRVINKSHDVEDEFVSLLLKEWDLYKKKLGFIPVINSLHFGGGTPTYLSGSNLNQLLKELTANKSLSFIGSIEIDPRTCKEEHLKVLSDYGIQRVSLGIQDFDPDVQKSINRFQSPKLVEELVQKLRSYNFSSINFDLIYGLPKQTTDSIKNTIEIVTKLKPDLIAFYSYAHLPERIKNQRLIRNDDLPAPEIKRELYELGKKLLFEVGYFDVGMDHFALPTSYLYKAKITHNLHRNFMGYVDKKSSILIGLGPTSISDSSLSYIQNQKDIKNYKNALMNDELPIEKGHTHTERDLKVQRIILDLMCKNEVSIEPGDIPYWPQIETDLKGFQEDQILNFDAKHLQITKLGNAFIRNIAMSFDFYLREKNHSVKFSQTI